MRLGMVGFGMAVVVNVGNVTTVTFAVGMILHSLKDVFKMIRRELYKSRDASMESLDVLYTRSEMSLNPT